MKPTVNHYRPFGQYYGSILVTLDGNEDCRPIKIPHPPSEDLKEVAQREPYFQALLEEVSWREGEVGLLKRILIILRSICFRVLY